MFAEQCCSHRIVARDNGGPTIEPVSQKISLPGEYVTVTDTDAHGRRWRRRWQRPAYAIVRRAGKTFFAHSVPTVSL
jgi:hypothetical protein